MKHLRAFLARIPRPFVTPSPACIFYLILIAVAVVYTQLLRSPASSLFFWFLILLPPVSALYLLIARLTLKVYVDAQKTTVEKMAPLAYEVKIINEFILPFGRVDAVMSLPQADAVRCAESRVSVSLLPLSSHCVKEEVRFPYRGCYQIGVKELIVWDFLHLFRMRMDVDIFYNVMVLPRRLRAAHESTTSATDVPTDSSRVVRGLERSEIGDIRDYMQGDSLKSIHWKLSSKTDDLQVKEYNTNTARSVYILCDFARAADVKPEEDQPKENKKTADRKRRHVRLKRKDENPLAEKIAVWRESRAEKRFRKLRQSGRSRTRAEDIEGLDSLIRETAQPGLFSRAAQSQPAKEEIPQENTEKRAPVTEGVVLDAYAADMDEYCADGVAEMAIAAAEHELRLGNSCTLVWFDSREESGIGTAEMSAPEDFDAIYPRFGTAPLTDAENRVSRLTLLVQESLNVTLRIATAHLDGVSLGEYAAVPSMFGGAGTGCITEILLFNPEDRYADVSARREYAAMCRERLAQDGVMLTQISPIGDGETQQ